jgi:uncharacterized repeat protein (TIGR01451 family)
MPRCRFLFILMHSVLGLFLLASSGNGQFPYPQPPQPPGYQLPPLLHVKFAGPAGMKVSFFRGTAQESTLVTPFTVSVRPGYIYRVEITDIPDHPGLVLHPTLEVRGSLIGNAKLKPVDFPVPVLFTYDDFRAIAEESMVTKVIALEKLENAAPLGSLPNRPLEYRVDEMQDPVRVAEDYGTPFLILRMGQRVATREELMQQGIPGTIQLPDEKGLPLPRLPAYLPWMCRVLYDPVHGPDSPWQDICIPDGGDTGLQAGHDALGQLRGLEPADTVAEYQDSSGRKKVAISNRVCVCVPRFIVVRGETFVRKQMAYLGPKRVNLMVGVNGLNNQVPVLVQHQNVQANILKGETRTSGIVFAEGTQVFGQFNGFDIFISVDGIKGVSSTCKTPEQTEIPDKALMLIKWPDKYGAAIGEIITFTLKYINQGGRPIQNVVVSDSLNTRFEYIPGSEKSDRAGLFTTQVNEAGSQILRWQIDGELPPGQSGMITFQVRVR